MAGAAQPARAGVVALDALELEIAEGELFGLLGPNGAGKTTTIGILTTRIRPTSGTVLVAGADVSKDSFGALVVLTAAVGALGFRSFERRSIP